ncbi:hypothetical protein EI94DRAFT_1728364 [Lactarius quietus]|nr:hypothetical protein EI94DRAFT_1728364 [Lactarius quietus]
MRARARSLITGLNDVFRTNCDNCLNHTDLGDVSAPRLEGVGELKRVNMGTPCHRYIPALRTLADMNPFISYPAAPSLNFNCVT